MPLIFINNKKVIPIKGIIQSYYCTRICLNSTYRAKWCRISWKTHSNWGSKITTKQSLNFDPRLRNNQNPQSLPLSEEPQKNPPYIPLKQNTNNNYWDAFKPFSDSIPKNLKMNLHLKSFPSSKAVQLNHHVKPTLQEYSYDSAIIHVGINDILHCKNYEELKELPNNIIKITHTCQEHNIGKIFSNLH